MNIYDFFGRFISEVENDCIVIVSYDIEGRQRRLFCNIYRDIISGGTTQLVRILNRTLRRSVVLSTTYNVSVEWAGDDIVLKINNTVVAKVKREPLREIIGSDVHELIDLQIEIATVLKSIAREGRLPQKYLNPIPEIPTTEEEAMVKKTSQPMIDDIPEDVFTMETVIDRIRNCGSIANAKEVPVIIRFDDKKFMITDTSVEDGFLYLDVIEVPKKKLEKPSTKFSDYIKKFSIGDGIWEQLNMNPYVYSGITSATSATDSSN